MFVCPHCVQDPTLHSFRIEEDTETHTTYHSFLSSATDTDVKRIMSHIQGQVEYQRVHHPTKTWSWIMDATHFTIQWHSLDLTYEIIDLIQTYKSTFTVCCIIHTNAWIKQMYGIATMFMSQEMKDLFVMEH